MNDFTDTIFHPTEDQNKNSAVRYGLLSQFDPKQYENQNAPEIYAAVALCLSDISPDVRSSANAVFISLSKNNVQFSMTSEQFAEVYNNNIRDGNYPKVGGYLTSIQSLGYKKGADKKIIALLNNGVKEHAADVNKDVVVSQSFGTAAALSLRKGPKQTAGVIANFWNTYDEKMPVPGYYATQIVASFATNYADKFKKQPQAIQDLAAIIAYAEQFNNLSSGKDKPENPNVTRINKAKSTLVGINKEKAEWGLKVGQDRFLSFKLQQQVFTTAQNKGLDIKVLNHPAIRVYMLSGKKPEPGQ